MIDLPVLARNLKGMEVVEAGGVAVTTAQNLSAALEYKSENAVHVIFTRNAKSFKDAGVVDLTQRSFNLKDPVGGDGFQIENPCSGGVTQIDSPCFSDKYDTALVQLYTPGRPDGNGGGGLQSVRVFTKRGAMKVCMKSNQPKAVMVQDMLLDLYEQVESGQLMGAERFGRMLEGLAQGLAALQQEVAHLKSRPPVHINLPDDTALPIVLERQRKHCCYFVGPFRFKEVRDMALTMRRAGHTYKDIVEAIRKRWPGEPEKHTSRSSVQRLWANARTGKLKEYGIDATIHFLREGEK